jgi:hypothetical protein
MSSGRLAGLVGTRANDPPSPNITHPGLQSRSAQIISTPCAYGLPHPSATTTTPPPRPSRPGEPGLVAAMACSFAAAGTFFGNRIGDGAHRRDALRAANVTSKHARWPLPNSQPQAPLAIPSTSHAAATAVPTAPPANTAPEILTRPVSGKPRHSARRGGEVDPSERQQLRATRSHSTA